MENFRICLKEFVSESFEALNEDQTEKIESFARFIGRFYDDIEELVFKTIEFRYNDDLESLQYLFTTNFMYFETNTKCPAIAYGDYGTYDEFEEYYNL